MFLPCRESSRISSLSWRSIRWKPLGRVGSRFLAFPSDKSQSANAAVSGTYIRVGYDELDRSDRTRASNFINRSLVNNSKYKSRGQWRREWLRARVTTDNRYRRDFFFRESNRLFPCFPLVGTVTHLPRAIITFFSMGLFEHARPTASCLSSPLLDSSRFICYFLRSAHLPFVLSFYSYLSSFALQQSEWVSRIKKPRWFVVVNYDNDDKKKAAEEERVDGDELPRWQMVIESITRIKCTIVRRSGDFSNPVRRQRRLHG